jgi:hypothetical protein
MELAIDNANTFEALHNMREHVLVPLLVHEKPVLLHAAGFKTNGDGTLK